MKKKSEAKGAKPADRSAGVTCECGCGGRPAEKRSRFLPGHDAKLKSALLKAKAGNKKARAKGKIE